MLAVVGEMQQSKSPTVEVLESMRPHMDGAMLLPEGQHAPLSTGLAAVDYLRSAYPHVPILLLGFDSHAEQPQAPGVVAAQRSHHSWTMWHDFGREKALLSAMPDVQHCAA